MGKWCKTDLEIFSNNSLEIKPPEHINYQEIARHLRKPEGEEGLEIAGRMNDGNYWINRNTIERLQLDNNDRVIELGMANGHFVKEIFQRFGDDIGYYGIDHSADMVQEAMKVNRDLVLSERAQFYHASLEKLPFEDDLVGHFFSINTIYFWNDWHAGLNEIRRVLKPKGTLTLAFRPKELMQTYPVVDYGFTTYTDEEVIELLRTNDFEISRSETINEPEQMVFGEIRPKQAVIIRSTPKKN